MPLAVTIHDLSFFAHPSGSGSRACAAVADARLPAPHRSSSPTRISRAEIESHLADVARAFSSGRRRRTRPRPASPLTPTVLRRTFLNRRRLPILITAFCARLATSAARVVIVGEDRTFPPQDLPAIAAAEGVAARTELRHYVSDHELRDLYAGAAAFAFLSEYEGFGLPPLEALAAGVPILLLDTPIAREIFGPSATFVPRGDIAATAAALRALLTSPEGREPLRHRADVLARYSWERAARATLDAIEAVARP